MKNKTLSMIARSLFTESKKLRVLDFDDTLVTTNSFIYVTHENGKKSKLTPGEYAVYEPKPNDEFDFSDFSDVKEPKEIFDMTTILRKILKSGGNRKTTILTARSSFKPIIKYLSDIGINPNKVEIIALGDSNPQSKADWITDQIDQHGFDDIYFADDSIKNIKAVKSSLKNKNVKYKVVHIK